MARRRIGAITWRAPAAGTTTLRGAAVYMAFMKGRIDDALPLAGG